MTNSERAHELSDKCRATIGDDEAAHGLEDDAREAALLACVAGEPGAGNAAVDVLSLRSLQFSRWCA